jgi:CRP/FNR family cyclic AMP-dependent transcriptional regulator
MSRLYRMVEDATLHSTRARVAPRLLSLASVAGFCRWLLSLASVAGFCRWLLSLASGDVSTWPKSRANVNVSQDTLAMMLGITRQTQSLELNALAEKRAIAVRYDRTEICSKDILSPFQDHL